MSQRLTLWFPSPRVADGRVRCRLLAALSTSDLPPRVRGALVDLTARRGFFRPPPPDTLFVHRKLAGTFLLCARLGARLDVHAVLRPFLDSAH